MAKYAGPDTTTTDGATSPATTRFSVLRMARLLEVSTSGYYAYAKRAAARMLTPRQQRRADLEVKITQIHQDLRGTYGSPRITAELRGHGELVTAKTVAKIMASTGLGHQSPHLQDQDDGDRSEGIIPAGPHRARVRSRCAQRRLVHRYHLSHLW
jgi:putative transposase